MITEQEMWETETPISELIKDPVPAWIDQGITGYHIAGICKGGCASGAYMPAVTYHQALETMNKYGDEIFEYIEDAFGEIPTPPKDTETWSGMACFYVSLAVELWASGVLSTLTEE